MICVNCGSKSERGLCDICHKFLVIGHMNTCHLNSEFNHPMGTRVQVRRYKDQISEYKGAAPGSTDYREGPVWATFLHFVDASAAGWWQKGLLEGKEIFFGAEDVIRVETQESEGWEHAAKIWQDLLKSNSCHNRENFSLRKRVEALEKELNLKAKPEPEIVDHGIALGERATCTKPYEFCLKTASLELRGIMTPLEYEYISGFIKRTSSMGGLTFTPPEAPK